MAKEKPPKKQAIDKSIRQPHHTMARPPAIFTEIHDLFIYGRLKPQNHETTPHRSPR